MVSIYINNGKNGDPGLLGVRQDAICADSLALVEKLNVAPYRPGEGVLVKKNHNFS